MHRRELLQNSVTGLGGVALAWLLAREAEGSQAAGLPRGLHHAPRIKQVIHVFSPGGVSQVDTWDHKPELAKAAGKPLTGKGPLDPFFGQPGNLLPTVFPFRQYGRSGMWVSDLFPHQAQCVDDLTFLHSVVAKSSSHTPACFQMNTGFTLNGYPSMGAWISYGMGSLNDQLPTFVVLPDPRGIVNGGSNNWSQGFLPAEHQGVAFDTAKAEPIAHLATPAAVRPDARRAALTELARLNEGFSAANPGDSALAARVRSYELAARMQVSIPEAIRLEDEPEATRRLYGLDDPVLGPSARNYLLARRLVERGVRFVQVFNGGALGSPRINWDAHEDVRDNHERQGRLLDQPVAALIQDLKQRGLLDETLVFWSSEFGRTPFTEGVGAKGRDHHNLCFTVWMAGGGLKPGFRFGESDEVGYQPGRDPVTVYDVHATILHLLGIDHTRLTFYHNGIQRRLTDVHGQVIQPILA